MFHPDVWHRGNGQGTWSRLRDYFFISATTEAISTEVRITSYLAISIHCDYYIDLPRYNIAIHTHPKAFYSLTSTIMSQEYEGQDPLAIAQQAERDLNSNQAKLGSSKSDSSMNRSIHSSTPKF